MSTLLEKIKSDYGLLLHGNFVLVSVTKALFIMVRMIRATVMGWYVYQATNDPFQLAWLVLFESITYMIATIFSGYLSDKYGRKKPTVAFAVGNIVLTFVICHLVAQPATSGILISIYACSAIFGIVRGLFGGGTLQSLISLTVAREHTPKATVIDGLFTQTAFILGPIIGGLAYDATNAYWSNMLVIPFMLIVLVMTYFIKDVIIEEEKTDESQWRKITAGFRFIFSDKVLKTVTLLDFFAVIFAGVTGLLPIYAKDILHVGPDGLGYLRSAISFGSLAAGFFLVHHRLQDRVGLQFLKVITLFGISLLIFAYSTNFYISFVFLFLSGAFDWYGTMIRGTIARLITPDRLQGRSSAARTFFASSANEISNFESNLVAGFIGAVPSVAVGGVITLIMVAVAWWRTPHLRDITLEEMVRDNR